MTFYWWSHWFWVTCLSVVLLPNGITHVHTYPSHEISLESTTQQEERMLERTEAASHDADSRRQTTKLYQTTASQTWATVTQRNIMDLTIKTTAPPKATPAVAIVESQPEGVDDIEAPFSDSIDDDDDVGGDVDVDVDVDVEDDDNTEAGMDDVDKEVEEATVKLTLSHNQFEFKRSADFASVPKGAAAVPVEPLSNYTNFSRSTSTNSSSACNATCMAAASSASGAAAVSTTVAATSTLAAAAATTKSTATATATATTTSTISPPTNSTGQAVPATPSTPKINTEWLSDELQRVSFTLENANKEDELRRAESEHRSRKSKVLSAEYKHINRYINYSSDTKSLLARSASAAPSISGYEAADEGNISSEALAIQRTYFLDAGAISAICFTVFGICCTVGTIGIVLYRRRYVNKPQALSEPDSSVYIDDSTMRVSDNSDEMYSLDNDSFLNSLEAMTIQNYWTDTVKHTKL
ncbi:pneumococcal serine-rich repeat protein isoform X1 [Drosophila mojavensis]|uniref:pneumococcal serine-rich repeat protein isoform X1 n=1 Tax=Drosophila mojavensis TaxID=7230 RepID=UPI00017CAB33|nr:pneumococcal serine-rich repeat protein isoform X1 [Drosophila mojavensis]XP_032588023.1 pneumococcal serine-rich repeat protein isoform X1 [Drosophila mojavensis]XP_043862912.1 pneumococcal serine-rich repeat protein isoform X1 [Drosophila mojavensis]XP_043862913.1 pneumococcal serine-rich repeat protein isoform X1 [Drosophila mojavensis]